VSGYEGAAQKVWCDYVQNFGELHTDPHGNSGVHLQGKSDFTVMIVGHVDEIGLIVKYINDKGDLWVARVGGLFDYRRKGGAFEEGYQSIPADWGIHSDLKKGFFSKLKEITGY